MAGVAAAVLAVAAGIYFYFFNNYFFSNFSISISPEGRANASATESSGPGARRPDAPGPGDEPTATASIELAETQLAFVKVEPVGERAFPVEKESVGSIDFDEDMTLQVFTPYQGRIIGLFAQVGDDVKKGQTLFTVDSPDLLQAESTLIAAAGVLDLTTRNLARLRELAATRAVSQKDLDQGISDQQTAEGALRAGRDSVRLFGKSEKDIDRIIAERRADPTLVVPSPINGRITARNAAPGLFVQPGGAPAPFSVADISTMWMLANVAESDSPALRRGQEVRVRVMALPDRIFEGKISTIGANVDPNTRRVLVRSEIADPQHQLRPGMFANFVIRTGDPLIGPAIPLDGVVREGDGTMSVWVTTDRRRFFKRTVRLGLTHDGYHQIVDGLKVGELAATTGALFLSNALLTASR
ncbi:MAG TPA: efflux RND transporter periplasmic adaptor subunit [Xanthobacteraceae bacterium]|nr:efflux RND transporter periplasmic adaptor subunit [Xanthobacteraceae bacterium]